METYLITPEDALWQAVIALAEGCSWAAGPYLARKMKNRDFEPWERVCAACVDGKPAGFCTFTRRDALPETAPFTPFAGFVFVGEEHREKRLSQRMLEAVASYARSLGYERLYLTSGEAGLYEKFGFQKLGDYETAYGTVEQLFEKRLV